MLLWDEALDTVTMGIQASDPNGNPDGTYLASYVGSPVNKKAKFDLSGSTSLTAGNVYHLVVEATNVTGAKARVYHGRMGDPNNHRVVPYDKREDQMWEVLSDKPGIGWEPHDSRLNREPTFVLYSGDTAMSDGNAFTGASALALTQYTVQNAGTTFGVTAEEVGAGNAVLADSIVMKATASGSPQTNLVCTIRRVDDFNTILATAEMTPAQANNTAQTLALDQPIVIFEGVDYVLMTDFAGVEADSTVQYKLSTYLTGWEEYDSGAGAWVALTSEGPATYGGTQWSEVTAPPGNLSAYTPIPDRDVWLGFEGRVVPEPMTLGLLAIGGLAALRRRRR
jgi:hypothetical protein